MEHVVAEVIDAHPEIDALDEDSLDKGRALLVDWAAQRLNAMDGTVRWGRKSRGRPSDDGRADRPNTDGLTFKRPDGKFEIYDVIVGATGKATWEGFGPFNPGENGYWAPPQLGPEDGVVVPPPPPPPPSVDPRIAQLEAQLAAERAANEDANRRIAEREATIADQLKELERLRALPEKECYVTGGPGWLRRLFDISCSVRTK
jgi:hypothetical protein